MPAPKFTKQKDRVRPWLLERARRFEHTCGESVCRATWASNGAVAHAPVRRRLQDTIRHGHRRAAGSLGGAPAGVTGAWEVHHLRSVSAPLPNPSVNRTHYGRPAVGSK